jgi:3-oxoacyl-[acyl-carrier-protein] synthase II
MKRVVITSMGAITPAGEGADLFWYALNNAVNLFCIENVYDVDYKVARIKDINTEKLNEIKSVRNLDRCTLITMQATYQVLHNLNLKAEELNDCGIILGMGLGVANSIVSFDRQCLREGPSSVNPALFPNTVMNSPASHAGIWFNMQRLNVTLSSGACSGVDAIGFGLKDVNNGQRNRIIVGGCDEVCPEMAVNQVKIKDDIKFGEGCGLLMLESLENAKQAGVNIYGEVVAYTSFTNLRMEPNCTVIKPDTDKALKQLLKQQNITIEEIAFIIGYDSKMPVDENKIPQMLCNNFGNEICNIPYCSFVDALGESNGAYGALAVVAASYIFKHGYIPGNIGYQINTNGNIDKAHDKIQVSKDYGLIIVYDAGKTSALIIKRG